MFFIVEYEDAKKEVNFNLMYQDGTRTIFISEKLRVGGKMLAFSTDKLDIAMSDDLSREEIMKVAGSMK